MSKGPIVVAGATGMQGGGVAKALLADGFKVRALSRDPQNAGSQALIDLGAEVFKGDFDDLSSLAPVMSGASGVFSVQMPAQPKDPDSEARTAGNLIEAARAAGVTQIVHTSVARAGDHESFVGWDKGQWHGPYWPGKAAANALIRGSGFKHWVILKPAFYMENFIPTRAAWMYPGLERGQLYSAMTAESKQDLLSAQDIAAFAVAAFQNPEVYHRQEIPIASQSLSMSEVAAIISRATGKSVTAHAMSLNEAVEAGVSLGVAQAQAWAAAEGYQVDLEKVRSYGLALDSFEQFAERHARDFQVG